MNFVDGTAAVIGQSGLECPVVYKVVLWIRVLIVLGALVFGLGWTYMTFSLPYARAKVVFNPVLIGVDALMIGGLAYGLAWALTARITLYVDCFEQHHKSWEVCSNLFA